MKTLKKLSWILAFSMGMPGANATVTLYDNLSNTAEAGAAVSPSTAASTFSTTTLCPTGCTLGNVTLKMLIAEDSTPDNVVLELYTDGGTTPGSLIATLANPATILDDYQDNIFTPQAQIDLDPNTIYWLQLSGTGDGGAWGRTFATNGPGSWVHDLSPAGGPVLGDIGNSPLIYKVEAEVSNVPVPASIWLMGTALTGLAIRARKKASS